jgi:hypothetical protein
MKFCMPRGTSSTRRVAANEAMIRMPMTIQA